MNKKNKAIHRAIQRKESELFIKILNSFFHWNQSLDPERYRKMWESARERWLEYVDFLGNFYRGKK